MESIPGANPYYDPPAREPLRSNIVKIVLAVLVIVGIALISPELAFFVTVVGGIVLLSKASSNVRAQRVNVVYNANFHNNDTMSILGGNKDPWNPKTERPMTPVSTTRTGHTGASGQIKDDSNPKIYQPTVHVGQ